MSFRCSYEEPNALLPFGTDIKVQETQSEQLTIMSFLAGLDPHFEGAKSHILFNREITSLKQVVVRVLRTDIDFHASPLQPTALVG